MPYVAVGAAAVQAQELHCYRTLNRIPGSRSLRNLAPKMNLQRRDPFLCVGG
jgi:hypothetical protein